MKTLITSLLLLLVIWQPKTALAEGTEYDIAIFTAIQTSCEHATKRVNGVALPLSEIVNEYIYATQDLTLPDGPAKVIGARLCDSPFNMSIEGMALGQWWRYMKTEATGGEGQGNLMSAGSTPPVPFVLFETKSNPESGVLSASGAGVKRPVP